MDLSLSPDDDAFRQEVRAFIRDHYPTEMRVKNPYTDLTKQQMLLWHRILHRKGWIAPSWPKELGGTGQSITQRYIWEQKTAAADTLPPLPFGLTMVGPVIYTYELPPSATVSYLRCCASAPRLPPAPRCR